MAAASGTTAHHSFAVFTLEDPDESNVQQVKRHMRRQAAQQLRLRQKTRIIRGISTNYVSSTQPQAEHEIPPARHNVTRKRTLNIPGAKKMPAAAPVDRMPAVKFIEPSKPVSLKKNRLHRPHQQSADPDQSKPPVALIHADRELDCESTEPVPPISSMTLSMNGKAQERRIGVTRKICAAVALIQPRNSTAAVLNKKQRPSERHETAAAAPILSPYDIAITECELTISKLIVTREALRNEIQDYTTQIDGLVLITSETDVVGEQDRATTRRVFAKMVNCVEQLRQVNAKVVQHVIRWRQRLKEKSIRTTGTFEYVPFLWNKVNYVVKMTDDIKPLLATASIRVLINDGQDQNNPMLLVKSSNQETTNTNRTFLTQNHPPVSVQQLREALLPDWPPPSPSEPSPPLNYQNAQDFLLAELRLELESKEQRQLEVERYENEHDPFAIIRATGSVDVVLETYQSKKQLTAAQVQSDLQNRQQDTTRIHPLPSTMLHGKPISKLAVNRNRLENKLALCRSSSHYVAPSRGKLNGSIVLSRHQVQLIRIQAADKILRQYRRFLLRRSVLQSLSRFVLALNRSAVTIQRISRGYLIRSMLLQRALVTEIRRKREQAAIVIQTMFRHSKKPIMNVSELLRVKKKQIVREQELQAQRTETYRRRGRQRRLGIAQRREKGRRIELLRQQVTASAAAKIQNAYRGYIARLVMVIVVRDRKAKVRSRAATTIQKYERRRQQTGLLAAKRLEKATTTSRVAATKIQCLFRGMRCRKALKIQFNHQTQQRMVNQNPLLLPAIRAHGDSRRHSLAVSAATSSSSSRRERRRSRRMSLAVQDQQTGLPPVRRNSIVGVAALSREELKLKSPELGDTF